MQRIYALLLFLLVVVAVASGCAHSPEVTVSGQQEITFEYRKN